MSAYKHLALASILLAPTPVLAQALEEENCYIMGTCQSQGMAYMGTSGGYHPADGPGITSGLGVAAAAAGAYGTATGSPFAQGLSYGLAAGAAFSAAVDAGVFGGFGDAFGSAAASMGFGGDSSSPASGSPGY